MEKRRRGEEGEAVEEEDRKKQRSRRIARLIAFFSIIVSRLTVYKPTSHYHKILKEHKVSYNIS